MYSLEKVEVEYEKEYRRTCIKRNQQRLLPISVAIGGTEILIILFQFLRFGTDLFKLDYFYIYLGAVIVSVLFGGIFVAYKKNNCIKLDMLVVQKLYMFSLLVIAVGTAWLELLYNENTSIVFIAFIFFVATMAHFDLLYINFLMMLGLVTLLLVAFVSIESYEMKMSVVLNLTFVCAICAAISIPFYNERVAMFNQKKYIEQQNRKLINANTQLEQLNLQLKETAETDALTGVANRFLFNKLLYNSFQYAITSDEPIAVIMIDIDDFKQYNDHYGHLQGDQCLIDVAKGIEGCLKRNGDQLFRYGGEEFIVLLSRSESKGACVIAERIIKAVEELELPHITRDGIVTISAGIYSMKPRATDSHHVLIDKADMALYKAKRSGKNNYVLYEEV